jgi:cell division protein FtsN
MATGRRGQQQPASNFAWMLFGLVLGLLVALVVYLRADRAAEPPASAPPQPARASAAPRAAADEPAPARDDRFDFYDVLPQLEVVIPEVDSLPRADTPVRAVEEPGRYVLQVGSFTTLGDADRMKANLALLGIESRIQRVTIDDDVYHRVRIGPIADLEELNQTRRRLRDARIEWMLMKVSDQ